mgnify:CR=1 FL=1
MRLAIDPAIARPTIMIPLMNASTSSALTPEAARFLRREFPFTAPQSLRGKDATIGTGDRLGLANPAHIQAVREHDIFPVLAQQSIRELERTERTPDDVMDAATWAVLEEGWSEPWGADADHLKTSADIDAFAAAGFTFFTIDPGDHVDARADGAAPGELADLFQDLPWDRLESTPADLVRYVRQCGRKSCGKSANGIFLRSG